MATTAACALRLVPGERPTTATTTTASGASRSTTTGGCSRSSASRASSPGSSWLTILRKRDAFRRAFAGFDAARVARFGARDVERLLGDAGIVRHRGKIESTINNARRALELRDEFGSLAAYVWRFEPDARPAEARHPGAAADGTACRPRRSRSRKDLKRRGWSFVGPTTVYAFMQAMGLVNDHLEAAHARPLAEAARAARTPGAPLA